MSDPKKLSSAAFAALYRGFQSPIAALNCGDKCAPYNENNVPFCCDTRHAVPTAYQAEWEYLQGHTNLWQVWNAADPDQTASLKEETPPGQLLISCLGHTQCQRGFRSITCRAFPFFPYLTSAGVFIGLSYYSDFEDRCWVISNLHKVTGEYRLEFIQAFEKIFELAPEEKESFAHHSAETRKLYIRRRRSLPLLHRNGAAYKVSPQSERMRRTSPEKMPKFGPYQVSARLLFPDEIHGG